MMEDIYRVDDIIENLPVMLSKFPKHSAPDIEFDRLVDNDKINGFLKNSNNFNDFFHQVRIDIIKFLIQSQYNDFDIQPYTEGNYAIVLNS